MGNLGMLREDEKRNIFSADGRSFVIALWEFAAFIANSLIFLLIGLRVAAMPLTGVGTESPFDCNRIGSRGTGSYRVSAMSALSVFDMGYTNT